MRTLITIILTFFRCFCLLKKRLTIEKIKHSRHFKKKQDVYFPVLYFTY